MNYLEVEKEMERTYNGIAKEYELEAIEDWADKKYVDQFLFLLPKNAKILDIGCGTGELLKYYEENHFLAYGIDIAEKMIEITKRKVPSAHIKKMSLYEMDHIKEKFNGISATFLFVHIKKEKVKKVIKSIYNKLEENGVFFCLFTTSLKEGLQVEPLNNNYKYYAVNYSNEEVCNYLLECNFEIIENFSLKRENKTDIGIIFAKKKKEE